MACPSPAPLRHLLPLALTALLLGACEAGTVLVAYPPDGSGSAAIDGTSIISGDATISHADDAGMAPADGPTAPPPDLTPAPDLTPTPDLADPGPPDLAYALPTVVINEIHYAPADKTTHEEFIELYNNDAQPVDLSGWQISDGVDFTFPANTVLGAGQYLVVASDPAAFALKFKGPKAIGPLLGNLSNNGDHVVLRDPTGHRADTVDYLRGFPWPVAGGVANHSIERVHPGFVGSRGASWRVSNAAPTPGAVNSVLAANAPPFIDAVERTPAKPTSGAPVYILANVADPDGVTSVTLEYQIVDPGAYVRLTDAAFAMGWIKQPMHDDGLNGDAVAGDGRFTAVIDPSVQRHRRLVRYRVSATDGTGRTVRVPYPEDPQPNFAWFVYDGVPVWSGASQPGVTPAKQYGFDVMGRLPVYHVIASDTDVTNCQYNANYNGIHFWATLVYDGEVYDHVEFEVRGQYSTYVSGKNKWRFHFQRAHDFPVRDNFGRPWAQPWQTMALSACASPWVPANRGMAGLDEAFASQLYQMAGVPAAHTSYFQLRVVTRALEADPNDQYKSDLWGLYLANETPDGRFLGERGLPDGNVYEIVSGQGVKKNQGPTQPVTNVDYSTFSTAFHAQQTTPWWRANVDLPGYYAYRATDRIVNDMDLRDGDNHFQYHNPVTGQWTAIPWDVDMLYMPVTHWPGVIGIQNAILQHPELYTEYRNRGRELQDLLFNSEQIGGLLAELVSFVSPPGWMDTVAQLDQAMWNYNPRTTGSHRGAFYKTPTNASFMGGTITRVLKTPDHAGMAQWIADFTTNGGYGARFLDSEVVDPAIPGQPTLASVGAPGFPADGVTLKCGAFTDPQGANTFGAMQWRVAEVTPPNVVPDLKTPRKYEVDAAWTSPVLAQFNDTITLPEAALRVGALHRARVRFMDNTQRWSRWSQPVEFTVAAPSAPSAQVKSLRVTELNYHPPGDLPEEFIELANVGAVPVDLSAVSLAGAVRFRFAAGAVPVLNPGERLVVVENRHDLRARYGANVPRVAGEYQGHLSNTRETVQLVYGANQLIQEFTYSRLWAPATDGGGRTLEIIDPLGAPAAWSDPAAWRASARYGGSPGQ